MKYEATDFKKAAELVDAFSWTDEELKHLVGVYNCLIAYFVNRPEHIIYGHLLTERNRFEDYLQARKDF
jgi:hypothetical protein